MLTPPFFLSPSAAAGSAGAAPGSAATDSAFAMSMRMWQCLYFLPLPHQHGSLRPSFGSAGTGAAAAAPSPRAGDIVTRRVGRALPGARRVRWSSSRLRVASSRRARSWTK